ncbi:MAG: sterol desaturase family protein [Trichodesmium sp. MAG_R03]|nr:sterol desaturase family protein [Trichodesmium sp. MAG_R03]
MITQVMIGWLALFITGIILWLFWEKQDPLRDIKYVNRFLPEFGAALVSIFFTIIIAYAYFYIIKLVVPTSVTQWLGEIKILSLPVWLRLALAYLIKDFCYYVAHWWMHHNKYLWQTHQWHHSIQQLWWLAAQRTSFTSRFLFQIGFIAYPLLSIPPEVMFYVGLFGAFHDNLVHLNIKWHSWMGKLEWLFVTPRYHSLHHTDIGAKNLGSYFTIFDRIFGTYIDPETLNPDEQKFGSVDEPMTWQKFVGI